MTLPDIFLGREFSPTFFMKWLKCPRLHSWHYVENLRRPGRLDYKMLFGSMWHVASHALDGFQSPKLYMDLEAQKIRSDPTYMVSDSPLIDRAIQEVGTKVIPKYHDYLTTEPVKSWETLAVEEKLSMKMNGLPVQCIPDKIIQDPDCRLWVIERKTTSRDDQDWLAQWLLNFQTTMEVILAEAKYGRPFEGVYMEQITITRRRVKGLPKGVPQDISKVILHPPRPVAKSDFLKEEAKRFVKETLQEICWRHQEGIQWTANYNSCQGPYGPCEMVDVCAGKKTAEEVLVPAGETK
jgi:hypothetical protein